MEAIFTWLAQSFDLPVLDWIAGHLTCPFLDQVMPRITVLGDYGIFWILATVLCLLIPRTRKAGVSMALALGMGLLICNGILKPLCARIRPYDYQLLYCGREISLLIPPETDFSFPSGHTAASFEAAAALCIRDRKWGIPALVLAGLIAFSRLYLYVHYPTDVLFSLVLGTGLAFAASALTDWLHRIFRRRGLL